VTRIKFLFMAVVLLVLGAGPAWGVNYNNPLDMDLYIIPTVTSHYMVFDNQAHTREYGISGTMRFEYDSNLVAYSPEVWQFHGTATYNWVTTLYREHVEMKKDGRVLTHDAWSGNPRDPMLYRWSLFYNASGSLQDFAPDDNGSHIVKIWLSNPTWGDKCLLKSKTGYFGGIMPYLSRRATNMNEGWEDRLTEYAKTLHFTTEQDQYFTKGDNILLTATQYIPNDFYVDDWQAAYTEDDAATFRPLFYYGTKAELTFIYKGDDHDTWSPVQFTRQVDLHGTTMICSQDTTNMTPGLWEVRARIIEMAPYSVEDYPVNTLRFTVVQKLQLWDGFDLSQISTSPSINYGSISFEAPMSNGQFAFEYNPVSLPIVGPTFKKTFPLAIDRYHQTEDLKFNLPQPQKASDIYIGFSLPTDPLEIFLLYPDKTLHPLADGLKPWKENVTEAVDEVIYDGELISALPKGLTLDVHILLTPHNDPQNYYYWKTFITTDQ